MLDVFSIDGIYDAAVSDMHDTFFIARLLVFPFDIM